jgi:hypothetical protein
MGNILIAIVAQAIAIFKAMVSVVVCEDIEFAVFIGKEREIGISAMLHVVKPTVG